MEDRYLFKAKRVDNGKWIIGSYVNCCYPNKENETGHFILEYPNKYHEIYTPTLCQCTGLEDKNGNLIWENDILVGYLDDNYPQDATYEMVLWNKSGFCTKEQGSNDILEFCEFDQKYFEVCGNTIDNPELFESEDNMTESEAIIRFDFIRCALLGGTKPHIMPNEENIGLVNAAIQALEKQIPYKPREYEDKYYSCKCGNVLLHKWKKYPGELMDKKMGLPYCLNCGQKIDWSE